MELLENKIREALLRLKKLTDGAIIYKPHYNVFSQEYVECVFDEIEYRFGKFFENGEELEYFKLDSDYNIGHPIKLNDVLEWLCLNRNFSFNIRKGVFYFFGIPWNLSSVYLKD